MQWVAYMLSLFVTVFSKQRRAQDGIAEVHPQAHHFIEWFKARSHLQHLRTLASTRTTAPMRLTKDNQKCRCNRISTLWTKKSLTRQRIKLERRSSSFCSMVWSVKSNSFACSYSRKVTYLLHQTVIFNLLPKAPPRYRSQDLSQCSIKRQTKKDRTLVLSTRKTKPSSSLSIQTRHRMMVSKRNPTVGPLGRAIVCVAAVPRWRQPTGSIRIDCQF